MQKRNFDPTLIELVLLRSFFRALERDPNRLAHLDDPDTAPGVLLPQSDEPAQIVPPGEVN